MDAFEMLKRAIVEHEIEARRHAHTIRILRRVCEGELPRERVTFPDSRSYAVNNEPARAAIRNGSPVETAALDTAAIETRG